MHNFTRLRNQGGRLFDFFEPSQLGFFLKEGELNEEGNVQNLHIPNSDKFY